MLAVGGVGGSGTRVISQFLKEIGYFMGDDLNESYDTLLFTLLFKRQNILTLTEKEFDEILNLFIKIMNSDIPLNKDEIKKIELLASRKRTLHDKEWLQQRVENITQNSKHNLWGWKEPNTHIIIEKLLNKMEDLKFIYVYRNGLDMAYSSNQNQLKLWGSIFLNDYNIEINPRNSLKYWCLAHRRVLELKEQYPTRIMMLDFDSMCINQESEIKELSSFTDINDMSKLKELIKVPESIGRYKQFTLDDFDSDDLEYIDTIYKK